MCLLDAVLTWDPRSRPLPQHHTSQAGNPLRSHERLGAACGIEYAAQAMAVHGALVAASECRSEHLARSVRGSGAAVGYLASVRNVSATRRATRRYDGELVADRRARDG